MLLPLSTFFEAFIQGIVRLINLPEGLCAVFREETERVMFTYVGVA